MPDIQNANDVQLYVESADGNVGTEPSAGRLAVDSFSLKTEEENNLESGVGNGGPIGHSRGNRTYSFSFVLKGEDKDLFETIAGTDGSAKDFNFRARGIEFTAEAENCRHTSIEFSGSDGDTTEWSVDGTAVRAEYGDSGSF